MAIIQRAAAALVLVAATVGLSGCFEGESIYLKCEGTLQYFSDGGKEIKRPYSAVVVLHKPIMTRNFKYITADHLFLMERLKVVFSGSSYSTDPLKMESVDRGEEYVNLDIVSGKMLYQIRYKAIQHSYDLQCKPQKRLYVII